ncbi:MFS transporter [Tsukamurella ocularis]|uniref:MFS transporter n=1 Tax=Tsukamurella ocularis TaxID=1970234 RepID=UPI002167D1CB|nr:MFS transporter [Tsukamurella ocularis]MCS3780231.1 EmrB/QacA subfamily drug resistance transporter [Tsukamurella ocularis]MCS3786215.1 EmrB/QacA subfamily drug resistance transporter [Tsukamurella ocularis]MCS3849579.1 EmrB/QacA subfamily drug resistance transporter [Tsukamurella ocularis]
MTSTMAPSSPAQTYRVKGSAIGIPILVLCGMIFLSVLDGTVVFVAMPEIQDALGLSDATKVWVFGAYALTFGGFLLLGGRLGDTFGRKKMFLLGVVGFTVASALAGFATNEAWLLAARVGQGLFAAIAGPTALALIATTFAPGKARNQAFAVFGAMAGLGSIAGLVAGGLLATVDWRLIFWINVPVGIACAIGGWFTLDEAVAERRHALDVKGAALAVAGCVTGVYALTAGPEAHWQSTSVYVAAVVSAICLVLFLWVERTAKNPILPFSLFNNRNRVAAMLAILVCGALIPTLGFYVALTFQLVLGYTPFQSGLALLPFAVGFGIAVAISASLVRRFQARWLVAFGGLIVFLPCLYVPTLMSKAPATIDYFPQIAIPVFLIGVGVGMAVVPLPLGAVAGVRPSEIGPLTALIEVAQNLGGIIGLASVQVVVTSRIMAEGGPTTGHLRHDSLTGNQIHALASGYGLAFIACAAILILAGLVVVPFMRFTPEEIAEGQAAKESSESGGAIPSTSFPAQAFEDDDDDVDDDWEPLEGDVTSGSFAAIRREDVDRAYNERPGDPEPVYFTDRFRAIKRADMDESASPLAGLGVQPGPPNAAPQPVAPQPPTQQVPVARPQQRPQPTAPQQAYSQPSGPLTRPAPTAPQQAYSHPSDPLPRPLARPGDGLAGIARPSGPIQRESVDLPRPPVPPAPRASVPDYRPPRPAPQQYRADPSEPRSGGPAQRPDAARPESQFEGVAAGARGGRHAAPESDGMHHAERTQQADRVSRARRHRRED